eukprot:27489-Eustigmatos_ZCMA.PRE.1
MLMLERHTRASRTTLCSCTVQLTRFHAQQTTIHRHSTAFHFKRCGHPALRSVRMSVVPVDICACYEIALAVMLAEERQGQSAASEGCVVEDPALQHLVIPRLLVAHLQRPLAV